MKKVFLFGLIFLVACSAPQVTITPDLTVVFTSTAYLLPIPTVVVTPTWSGNYDEMIATVSAAQTYAVQFPRICDNYSPNTYSPNSLWLVELCYSEDDNDLVLTLANRETQVLWKLLYHDYIPELDFFPDGGMSVVHWSNDGRYAYFTSFLGGDGGECFLSRLDTGDGLFRIDLQTGEAKAILPLNDDFVWYGFSISPTDRRLVYGVRSLDLKLLDITTGQLISVSHKKEFSQGGGYVWSPNGLEFVYSTVTYAPDDREREGYSLRLVDAQTGVERILFESKTGCYLAKEWKDDGILTIEYDDENYNGALMEYDLNSNTIIEASASPAP